MKLLTDTKLGQAREIQYHLRRVLMTDADLCLLTVGQRRQVQRILNTVEESIVATEKPEKRSVKPTKKGVNSHV